jgi:hypothetical protein
MAERTLCCEGTAGDAVCDFLEARIHVEHFGWCGLQMLERNGTGGAGK